ncbi:MAG: hybrid sensor histidine kinase/response regulator [Gemmataceae bacterium]|nr:hybrid sensor histidine kinase/response regulator [Gemmataceae bacterium]
MPPTRILIAEDEGVVAEDIKERLARLGYAVVGVVASGEEAVALAAATRPDLVLMDIRLQGEMDGIAAAARLGADHDIPVVYLTAFSDPATLERAKLTGPLGYLLKPFKERELHSAVEIAVYKHAMERRLRDRERWLTTTLKSVGDAILTTDPRGVVTFLNPAAEAATGWAQAEAEGKPWTDVLRLADERTRDPVEGALATTLRDGVVVTRPGGALLAARDGTDRPVDETAAPIRNEKDQLLGAVVVFHDITARRRLEEQERQARQMEAVGRLAGGVAHDFNNLMTVVLGYSELLRSELHLSGPHDELLTGIIHAGQQAAGVTRQLLTFARKQMVKPVVLQLNSLITAAESAIRGVIGADVALVTKLAPDLGAVKADPVQLQDVLQSVAASAGKAMSGHGQLTLETANIDLPEGFVRSHYGSPVQGAHVLLTVADTGPGMDTAARARLFEPYPNSERASVGEGLGLAPVYGAVRQSDGHIVVESAPGRGTTFKIYLPRVDPPRPAAGPPPGLRDTPGGTETILLVEGEEAVRKLHSMVLRTKGYTVIESGNGAEGLVIGQHFQRPIHLLLTDVLAPKLSGGQLLKRLISLRPDLKVLFISGYAADDPAVREVVLGAEAELLEKPFTPFVLVRKVREILDG